MTQPPPHARPQHTARHLRGQFWLLTAGWAGASMIVAILSFIISPTFSNMSARGFAQAFGAQCLLWGLVSAGVALFGLRQTSVRRSPERETRDRDDFIRLLRFAMKLNAALAVAGAMLLVFGWLRGSAALAGHGAGVFVLCAGLFLMDRQGLSRIGATRL